MNRAPQKDNAFTMVAGYRGSGSFTDANTEQSLALDGSGAGSLALDIGLDASQAGENRHTSLSWEDPVE